MSYTDVQSLYGSSMQRRRRMAASRETDKLKKVPVKKSALKSLTQEDQAASVIPSDAKVLDGSEVGGASNAGLQVQQAITGAVKPKECQEIKPDALIFPANAVIAPLATPAWNLPVDPVDVTHARAQTPAAPAVVQPPQTTPPSTSPAPDPEQLVQRTLESLQLNDTSAYAEPDGSTPPSQMVAKMLQEGAQIDYKPANSHATFAAFSMFIPATDHKQ